VFVPADGSMRRSFDFKTPNDHGLDPELLAQQLARAHWIGNDPEPGAVPHGTPAPGRPAGG
jgi:hypothetical protein